jgi:predicted alpha/beta superfamily hydrolase
MKKLIPILLILLIASCKKEQINPDLISEFSIHSENSNATYTIKVCLPEKYDPANKYTTLYVLDGEENFSYVSENVKCIGNCFSSADVIVVSIGYGNDRTLDYTPSKANEGEGGAENFMRFIKHELIPQIEKEYSADSSRQKRIILGHSYGGLLAAYAFTNFNDVFGNYLLLSPSIWYDNEIELKLEKENRVFNKDNNQLVFMGIGGLESSGRMLGPHTAFYQQLRNNYSNMKIANHVEPHLNHVGSKNPNIKEALKFYFQNR